MLTELELLDYVIICGKCGTESNSLWCEYCWQIMEYFEKSKPIPAYRCLFCEYPEPTYLVHPDKYCVGCGIRYGVELIPVPKKKIRMPIMASTDGGRYTISVNIDDSAVTATSDIIGMMYYPIGN